MFQPCNMVKFGVTLVHMTLTAQLLLKLFTSCAVYS